MFHTCTIYIIIFLLYNQICVNSYDIKDKKFITVEDITNHPDYKDSMPFLIDIEKNMKKSKYFNRGIHNTFIHITPILLKLVNAAVVMEIGSYCGANLILTLSVPTVTTILSIDQKGKHWWDTSDIINQNVDKYNKYNAVHYQLAGMSLDGAIVKKTLDLIKPNTVDYMFLNGAINRRPDFMTYQHLLKPGGVIAFDDYGHVKKVIKAVNAVRGDTITKKCFHEIGQAVNVANATHLHVPDLKFNTSNIYLIQKNFDCLDSKMK